MAGTPVEERSDDASTRRIRVGALGLACVFLLVMLATALLRVTSDTDLVNREAAAAANKAEPAEPLAQLGVVPGNPTGDETPEAAAPAPRRRTVHR